MKKYFSILLLLVASLTLSACGSIKNQNTSSTNSETETVNTQGNNKKTDLKSLKDLLTLGSTQKCSFESKDEQVTTTSEIIVSGKKFKQVTEIKDEEGSMKVYAVSDGTYYYYWNDKIKENGMKIKMEEIENGTKNDSANEENQGQVDINKEYNYKCVPATLTENDLALPKDVKFTDLTEFMKGLQNGNADDLKKLVPSGEE